jgi:hypothetical protein
MEYLNQERKRQAEFIKPPNALKSKVGAGGLGEDILDKAQEIVENNKTDFIPLAEMYLDSLQKAIELAKNPEHANDDEYIFSLLIYPTMQLKANGGMFRYPLITKIAERLVYFLEVLDKPDAEAMEIAIAFHTSMRAVITRRVTGDNHGKELLKVLEGACQRYFNKHTE